jgi:hypothetical protein
MSSPQPLRPSLRKPIPVVTKEVSTGMALNFAWTAIKIPLELCACC